MRNLFLLASLISISAVTFLTTGCTKKTVQPTETYEVEVNHPVAYHCPSTDEVKYEGDGFLGAKTYYNDVYMRWSGSIPDMDYPKLKVFEGAEMICNEKGCQVSCLYKLINMQGTIFLWATNDYDENFIALSQPNGIWQNNACKSKNVNDCAFYINPN